MGITCPFFFYAIKMSNISLDDVYKNQNQEYKYIKKCVWSQKIKNKEIIHIKSYLKKRRISNKKRDNPTEIIKNAKNNQK